MKSIFALMLIGLLAFSSCLPKTPAETNSIEITVYGFSIMKEVLEKEMNKL